MLAGRFPANGFGKRRSALRFVRALAARLGASPDQAIPGYEDAWYYLWKERRLPVNVDPHDSKLKEPEERERLARVLEKGLDKVVGYALPLRRDIAKNRDHDPLRTFDLPCDGDGRSRRDILW